MKNLIEYLGKNYIANIISFLGLIFLIVWNVMQQNTINETDIKIKSKEYLPRLEVIDKEGVDKYGIAVHKNLTKPLAVIDHDLNLTFFYTNRFNEDSLKALLTMPNPNYKVYFDSTRNIQAIYESAGDSAIGQYFIENKLTLKNSGNSLAKLEFVTFIASIKEEFILRDWLLGRDKTLEITPADPFLQTEILPNKETLLNLKTKIDELDTNRTIVIHYLFIYKNEYDILYDTYYKVKFTNVPAFFEAPLVRGEMKGQYHQNWQLAEFKEEKFIQKSQKISFKIYTGDEADEVNNYLKFVEDWMEFNWETRPKQN